MWIQGYCFYYAHSCCLIIVDYFSDSSLGRQKQLPNNLLYAFKNKPNFGWILSMMLLENELKDAMHTMPTYVFIFSSHNWTCSLTDTDTERCWNRKKIHQDYCIQVALNTVVYLHWVIHEFTFLKGFLQQRVCECYRKSVSLSGKLVKYFHNNNLNAAVRKA